MPKQYEDFTTDGDGDERHPAFGLVSLHRISSRPGAVLFQSDTRHPEYMQITVNEATRARSLHHDWVRRGRMVCQISLSAAQFASFVASTGQGDGVPCTIAWTGSGSYEAGNRPELYLESRLAQTTNEVRAAADEAFSEIKRAETAYWAAIDSKPPLPAAERKRLRASLQAAIRNAAPNVEYAAEKLDEHAEAVVEQSRADIEAMVVSAQGRQNTPNAVDGPGLVALSD